MTTERKPGMGRSKLLKVVLLGDGGVGKSSLMNRFVSNKFDSQSFHTIGVEFLNKDITVSRSFLLLSSVSLVMFIFVFLESAPLISDLRFSYWSEDL
jgi:GTPase SAR1 family protein